MSARSIRLAIVHPGHPIKRSGYQRFNPAPCKAAYSPRLRRSDDVSGFKVLPRRWVVERTFGWVTRWHGLVRDYEKRLDVSEAMIHLAMVGNLLRRLTA